MFTGETTFGWLVLLLAAMLFWLDFFHWKRFRQKIQVAIPWNVPLVFLIAFAGTGLFCVGLAIRIIANDLSASLGSAERWLLIGFVLLICALICSHLHKKEEERNVVPLSQIPLLPAKIQYAKEQVSTEPLMLPVHVPRHQHLQLIENPKRQRQRNQTKNRLALFAVAAATIALVWVGARSLLTTNTLTLNTLRLPSIDLPAERAIPTPTAESEPALVQVLAAPQNFFSAAATGVQATFAAEQPTEQSVAPSELESAVTAADLNLTSSIVTSETFTSNTVISHTVISNTPIPEPQQDATQELVVADSNKLTKTEGTAVIAIGGPIDSGENAIPTADLLSEDLVSQNLDVVIQSDYGANVRARPSTDAEIITALPAGIRLTAVGRSADGQWLRVRLAISTGAWVAVEVVDDGSIFFEEGLIALPSVE